MNLILNFEQMKLFSQISHSLTLSLLHTTTPKSHQNQLKYVFLFIFILFKTEFSTFKFINLFADLKFTCEQQLFYNEKFIIFPTLSLSL
jgi:hypothetical protein